MGEVAVLLTAVAALIAALAAFGAFVVSLLTYLTASKIHETIVRRQSEQAVLDARKLTD